MRQDKIYPVHGYMVNGHFQKNRPVVDEITRYEFRGVKYPTMGEAEEAKNTLTNQITITKLLEKLIGAHVNGQHVASRIMTTNDGVELFNALKSYFEDTKKD